MLFGLLPVCWFVGWLIVLFCLEFYVWLLFTWSCFVFNLVRMVLLVLSCVLVWIVVLVNSMVVGYVIIFAYYYFFEFGLSCWSLFDTFSLVFCFWVWYVLVVDGLVDLFVLLRFSLWLAAVFCGLILCFLIGVWVALCFFGCWFGLMFGLFSLAVGYFVIDLFSFWLVCFKFVVLFVCLFGCLLLLLTCFCLLVFPCWWISLEFWCCLIRCE